MQPDCLRGRLCHRRPVTANGLVRNSGVFNEHTPVHDATRTGPRFPAPGTSVFRFRDLDFRFRFIRGMLPMFVLVCKLMSSFPSSPLPRPSLLPVPPPLPPSPLPRSHSYMGRFRGPPGPTPEWGTYRLMNHHWLGHCGCGRGSGCGTVGGTLVACS